MGNSIVNWIEQWLTDRRQKVVVDGEVSSWKSVLSGVPQGSVLGPILLLAYIRAGQEYFECTSLQVQVLSTTKVLKYKYIPFWGNVLKYIPSTFKMYLSTIRSTFHLPGNFCTR